MAALLIGAAAAELSLGRWFSQDPLDRLGLDRDLAQVVDARGLYPGAQAFVLRHDHWGFRGGGDNPAGIAVLTLGGMATYQPLLPEDQTWQQVMRRQFQINGRRDVTIANGGSRSQDTAAMLKALRDWLAHVPDLHPRFILAHVGQDEGRSEDFAGVQSIDLLRSDFGAALVNQAVGRFPAETERFAKDYPLLRRHSGLYRWWQKHFPPRPDADATPELHLRIAPAAAHWTDTASHPLPPDVGAMDAYRSRLKTLADEIHAMGAVPVFITAIRGDFKRQGGKVLGLVRDSGANGLDEYNALEQFNAATRAVCREQGLLCLDLAGEVPFEPNDFYDYVHMGPAGAEKIGRWLYGKLAGLV